MDKESECLGSWLHRYAIVKQFPEGVEEMCLICKDRQFFRVFDGRIDNYNYIKYHNRQCLQPYNPFYSHEYGKK